MPCTEHALLKAGGNVLHVMTMDYTQTVTAIVEAGVTESGEATFLPGLVKNALQGLEGKVELSGTWQAGLMLKQGRRRYKLESIDPSTYPTPPNDEGEQIMGYAHAIGSAIEVVSYAAMDEHLDERQKAVWLSGKAVGALCIFHGAVVELEHEMSPMLIPKQSCAALVKAMKQEDAVVLAYPNAIEARSPNLRVRTNLYAGQPTDWRRVFPDQSTIEGRMTFEPGDALAALGRVIPFLMRRIDGTKATRVVVEAEDGVAKVRSHWGNDLTEDEFPCEGESFESTPIEASRLLSLLRVAGKAKVTWHTQGPSKPSLFTVEGRKDVHLLMALNG